MIDLCSVDILHSRSCRLMQCPYALAGNSPSRHGTTHHNRISAVAAPCRLGCGAGKALHPTPENNSNSSNLSSYVPAAAVERTTISGASSELQYRLTSRPVLACKAAQQLSPSDVGTLEGRALVFLSSDPTVSESLL